MAIEVKEIETGYAVKFPFELKDNFKSVFKTAKWNPIAKQWEVGKRFYKKLVEWTEAAQGFDAELEKSKEIEEAEADLFAAKAQIQTLKDTIVARRKSAEQVKALFDELQQARSEIDELKAEVQHEEAEALKTRSQLQKFLDGVIDFKAINDAKAQMVKLHRSVGNRHLFDEQQNIIRAERDKLRKVGFESLGLNNLCRVNYNRPDRDNIAHCGDILAITRSED